MLLLFCTSIIFLNGCASLSSKVFQNIHEGDSSKHIVEMLGKPDAFGPSQRVEGGTAWYYSSREEVCGFSLKDDVVKHIACDKNPNYVHPAAIVGTMLQGIGKGLGEGSRTPASPSPRDYTCTPSYGNNFTCSPQ